VAVGGGGGDELGPVRDLDAQTSGRVGLAEGGLELFEDRPIAGWGSGAFGRAYLDKHPQSESTTSHSEPLTVAAEQGIVGLAVYVALLGATAWVLLGAGAGSDAPRAAIAACMAAMIAHSIGYAGFAIDPATWALLGLGVALRRSRPVPAAVPTVAGDRGTVPPRDRRPAAVQPP
jgi:O-antigen ligase